MKNHPLFNALTPAQLAELDQTIRTQGRLYAILLLREISRCSLAEAQSALYDREKAIGYQRETGISLPSYHEALQRCLALPSPVQALEAQWDGDSDGWMLELCAVTLQDNTYQDHRIATRQGGGREIEEVSEIAHPLAKALDVPFYFPAPHHPEDETPHWWQRHEATPCRVCGTHLYPRYVPLRDDICYRCSLSQEPNP